MYTRSFYRLSEMYFKESLWPHVDEIADFVDNDPIFCWLYQARTKERDLCLKHVDLGAVLSSFVFDVCSEHGTSD